MHITNIISTHTVHITALSLVLTLVNYGDSDEEMQHAWHGIQIHCWGLLQEISESGPLNFTIMFTDLSQDEIILINL
jgi:hypothetical protein